jgi:type II secretory pathway component PulF
MSQEPFEPTSSRGAVYRETSTYMTDPQAQKFCEIFAEGLDSGIGYARILTFLERKGFGSEITAKLHNALLEDGMQLGAALARHGILDPAARKLVLVAEDQGTLPQAFKGQIPVYRNRYERKKHILFSFVEPGLLAFLAFFILIPLVSNIKAIYDAGGGSFFEVVGNVGKVVGAPILFGFTLVLMATISGWAWLNTPVEFGLREVFMRLWMRIPGLSAPSRLYAVSLFTRYLGVSITGGMNIFDSIFLAAEASNDPRMLDAIDVVLDAVEEGSNLHQSLSIIKALPDDALDYIGLGEETGRMSEQLKNCADVYEKRAKEMFDQYMATFTYLMRFVLIIATLVAAFLAITGSLFPLLSDMLR